jgi:thioredoxin-like negative regulator of GroEL
MSDPVPTPVIVAYHFWSPTCGPCERIKKSIAELPPDFPAIRFVGVNTHNDPQGISAQLRVSAVPTMVVLKDGVEIARYSGVIIEGYYKMLRNALTA